MERLAKKRVQVKAVGEYPDKRNTKVQDVAKYQNDGTDRGIEPARFVERAESDADHWNDEVDDALDKYTDGYEQALHVLGSQVSADIGDMCDRIRTGRLKKSFRGDVK